MSIIVENTLVIKRDHQTKFLESFNKAKENYMDRPSNLKLQYEYEDILIYIFDSNGEPLFLMDDDVPFLILEYRECGYTTTFVQTSGEYRYKEHPFHIGFHLKKLVPDENTRKEILEKVKFSI